MKHLRTEQNKIFMRSLFVISLSIFASNTLAQDQTEAYTDSRIQEIQTLLREWKTEKATEQSMPEMPGTESPIQDRLVILLAQTVVALHEENRHLRSAITLRHPDVFPLDPRHISLTESLVLARTLIRDGDGMHARGENNDHVVALYRQSMLILDEIAENWPSFLPEEVEALRRSLLGKIHGP